PSPPASLKWRSSPSLSPAWRGGAWSSWDAACCSACSARRSSGSSTNISASSPALSCCWWWRASSPSPCSTAATKRSTNAPPPPASSTADPHARPRGGSMGHEPHLHAGLVVQGEAVDDIGACPVIADHFHLCAAAPQPRHDLVERRHRRNIPEMRGRHVDPHLRCAFPHIERAGETIDRCEEQLSGDVIDRLFP